MQAVLFGLGGLTLRAGRLDIDPPPPSLADPSGAAVRELALEAVHWQGSALSIRITANLVRVGLIAAAPRAPALAVAAAGGEELPLEAGGEPLSLPRGAPHAVVRRGEGGARAS